MRDDGAGVRDDDIYGVLQGGGGGRGGRALARNPCGGALSTVARTASTVTSQCSMEARVVHDDRRIERAGGGGRRTMVAACGGLCPTPGHCDGRGGRASEMEWTTS